METNWLWRKDTRYGNKPAMAEGFGIRKHTGCGGEKGSLISGAQQLGIGEVYEV